MKRVRFLLFIFVSIFSLVTLTGTQAMAYNINGDWDDWGITILDGSLGNLTPSDLTPSAGISFWTEDDDDTKNDYQVGPGWGGQNFDAEAIYATIESGLLYFAVVSGAHSDNGFDKYEPGDIIITTTTAMYALETTGVRYNLNGSGYVQTITALPGSVGKLYEVNGNHSDGDTVGTLVMDGLYSWSGLTDNQDPVQIWGVGGPAIGSGAFAFNTTATDEHSFMEGCVDLGLLSGDVTGVHWALACGNDGGTVPIPEPATMLLFGCGLIGLAVVGRKKFQ